MRSRPRVSGLLLLAILLIWVGCGKSPQQYVEIGNRQLKEHKYPDASINFRKAIQKDGSNADAYYGLGQVLLQQGNPRDAYSVLTRAVDLAPRNFEAKQKLANLALAAYLGDRRRPKNLYEQINKLSDQFLAHDPSSYDGLRLRAYIAINDNQRAEGIDYFRKALQAKPLDPEVTVNLAAELFQEEATAAEAERLTLDLIGKKKEAGPAYDLLYRYYASTKRPAEAEKILKAKVAANPGQGAYLLELAGHYRRAGQPEQMKSALATLLSDPKAYPQARLQAGDFYNQTGDPQQALKYYEEGAQSATKDKLVYEKREVAALTTLRQPERALERVQASLKENPKDADLHMARALLLLDQRKADAAIEELQGMQNAQKDNPVVKFQLGRALLLKGRAKEATAAWQEAAQLRPDYVDPKLALAVAALDGGHYQDAQRYADAVLSASPSNLRAQLVRSGALQGLGQAAEAESLLSNLRKQLPGNPDVDIEFAFLKLRQNKPADAESIFRTHYKPGQENLRTLTGLVEALILQKHGDQAVRIVQADLAEVPGRPQVQMILANTYALTGQTDAAVQTLDQLIAAHPDNADAQLRLGQLQFNKGALEPALASFQKARDLVPQSIAPLLFVAQTADRLGRNDLARQSYQAALKIDPANLLALNNLAFLTADTGGNLDEAFKLITQASQKVPKQPNVTDTLGYVYLKQKKVVSALEVFAGLTQTYPTNPTFLFHHGLALLESGSKDQAKKELQAALAAKPSPDLATKIKEALGRTT